MENEFEGQIHIEGFKNMPVGFASVSQDAIN
jgi:hypothetical protein